MTDDFLSPDTMTEQYVHWFRNSAPYINAHRGKTFVVGIAGEAIAAGKPHAVSKELAAYVMDAQRVAADGEHLFDPGIGGLIRMGLPADRIEVVEPWEEARTRLAAQFGIQARAQADAALARCGLVVWAVKPQTFRDAAAPEVRGAKLETQARARLAQVEAAMEEMQPQRALEAIFALVRAVLLLPARLLGERARPGA